MTNRIVWVENMTKATVTIIIRNANFKRTLKGEGAKASIPFDILYEGLSEPGIGVMLEKGYIRINNKQDRIDLGLETTDDINEIIENSLDSSTMLKILKDNNPVVIKQTLEQLAETQRIKFANVAATNGIYSPGLAKLVKDYTNIDLLKMMQDIKEQDLIEDNK